MNGDRMGFWPKLLGGILYFALIAAVVMLIHRGEVIVGTGGRGDQGFAICHPR
jgi:hypothetical protein